MRVINKKQQISDLFVLNFHKQVLESLLMSAYHLNTHSALQLIYVLYLPIQI